MEEHDKLISFIGPLMSKTFPKNHQASKAYAKYCRKETSTLSEDTMVVYEQYKDKIESGDTTWLSDNLVILGTKECGIYISMLYRKSKDNRIPCMFREYASALDCSTTESHSSSSYTSSDEDSEYGGDTPMDMVRDVFEKIKPELIGVVDKMEMPPPNGVNLSSKTKAMKEADIASVKNGLRTFEETISRN